MCGLVSLAEKGDTARRGAAAGACSLTDDACPGPPSDGLFRRGETDATDGERLLSAEPFLPRRRFFLLRLLDLAWSGLLELELIDESKIIIINQYI